MPLMVMAAHLCPVGLEASVYSTVLAAFNLGGAVSPQVSAGLMLLMGVSESNMSRLPLFVCVCVSASDEDSK